MKEPLFKCVFVTEGFEKYKNNSILRQEMEKELVRCYHVYVNEANGGITEKLNNDFKSRYPNYFEQTKDKEWYEKTLYNKFMSEGYNRLICGVMNNNRISDLLEFRVDVEEVEFVGILRSDKTVKIRFYLKQVN